MNRIQLSTGFGEVWLPKMILLTVRESGWA